MWIVFDLLAIVGAWTVCAWIVRLIYGSSEPVAQVPRVFDSAPPVDAPKEVKAKRQPRKRKVKA